VFDRESEDYLEILTNFISTLKENNLGVYGIHIYHNGKVLGDYCFRSNGRENLCSVSNTFVSVDVGIAESEGLIQLTDHILHFPRGLSPWVLSSVF